MPNPSFAAKDSQRPAAGFKPAADINTLNPLAFATNSTPIKPPTPSTDPHYKYRHAYRTQPGLRFVHAGLVDTKPPTAQATSVPAHYASNFDGILTHKPQSALQQTQVELSEAIYRSTVYEPLGRGYNRNHKLPAETAAHDFRFGLAGTASQSVKELIYAPVVSTNGSIINEPIKTINQCSRPEEVAVTAPSQRDYNWSAANIDPAVHRFGSEHKELDITGKNVAIALKHVTANTPTELIKTRIVTHKALHSQAFGKGRPAPARIDELTRDPNFAFGAKQTTDEWNAQRCIKGEYKPEQQMADADLGRSTTALNKYMTVPAEHQSRTFGIPSIRTDIPKAKNGIDDDRDINGSSVIQPSEFAHIGVDDTHFRLLRSRDEIRQLFSAINIQLKEYVFNRICTTAETYYGELSVDSFRAVYNHMIETDECQQCGALRCQHDECIERLCCHDGAGGIGNHRRMADHEKIEKVLKPPLIQTK